MERLSNVNQILIEIKVEENHVLFLMFSDDGVINRKGNGNPDCKDNLLVIGKTKYNVFQKIKPYITSEMEPFLDQVLYR